MKKLDLIKKISHKHGYYKIDELQIGGHCGLCGKWINDEILPKIWAITLCKKCERCDFE